LIECCEIQAHSAAAVKAHHVNVAILKEPHLINQNLEFLANVGELVKNCIQEHLQLLEISQY
jgi:hypothetical protein